MSNARKPSRAVADLGAIPGPVTARLLTVGALGSAAAMMALSAGSPAATAASSHGPAVTAATLTADVQQPPAAGGQPTPPSATASPSGTGSSTFSSISDFFSAAGTRIQNAASAVGDAFSNIMTDYGHTQVVQAQGTWVFYQTLPYAMPNAVQTMKEDGETGLLGGTGIGLAVGGLPGAGVGLELGAGSGATEGFLRGLLAPIPGDVTQKAFDQFNSIISAGQGATVTGATDPGTGLPQGLASELGLGPGGIVLGLSQGSGTATSPWPTASSPGQQQGGSQDGAGTQSSPAPGTQNSADPGTQNSADPGTQNSAAPGTQNSAAPGTQSSVDPGTTVGDLGSPADDGASAATVMAGTVADQQTAGLDQMAPVADPTDPTTV